MWSGTILHPDRRPRALVTEGDLVHFGELCALRVGHRFHVAEVRWNVGLARKLLCGDLFAVLDCATGEGGGLHEVGGAPPLATAGARTGRKVAPVVHKAVGALRSGH